MGYGFAVLPDLPDADLDGLADFVGAVGSAVVTAGATGAAVIGAAAFAALASGAAGSAAFWSDFISLRKILVD